MSKKQTNKTLTLFIILLVIMIIVVGVILFFILKNDENTSNNNNTEISSDINIIEKNSQIQDFVENNSTINKEKKYIEMTEKNYKQYNQGKYTFRIQDATKNKDGTVTIKGRVYEYVSMPETLTKEQVEAISNDGALRILGEKVIKVEDGNLAKEVGYDMALIVESTAESEYQMLYYLKKNSDGTAKLVNGSEASILDGTDIYMQITLNGKMICGYGPQRLELNKIYEKDFHVEDKNRIRAIYDDNSYFYFSKGVCVTIDYDF